MLERFTETGLAVGLSVSIYSISLTEWEKMVAIGIGVVSIILQIHRAFFDRKTSNEVVQIKHARQQRQQHLEAIEARLELIEKRIK